MIKYLIDHGATESQYEYSFVWSLIIAYEERQINEIFIEYLNEQGINDNNDNNKNKNDFYLIDACQYGNMIIIKYLLEHGTDINIGINNSITPSFTECINGYEYIVKYLVEHGADMNQVEERYCLSLMAACLNENETLVKYLVEHGANVNYKGCYYYQSPLMISCENDNEALVKYLVEHRVKVNEQDKNECTP